MSIAAAKQVVAAGNLANVNTPGYRARAVDVHCGARERARWHALATGTTDAHLHGTVSEAVGTAEVDGLPMRRDGNNVQIDRELLTMSPPPAISPGADRARRQVPHGAVRVNEGTLIMPTLSAAITASASALNAERDAHRGRGLEPRERGIDARRDGQPYRRRDVVLASDAVHDVRRRARQAGATGVQVAGVVEDQTPFRRRYEPSHPDADAEGSCRCRTWSRLKKWST